MASSPIVSALAQSITYPCNMSRLKSLFRSLRKRDFDSSSMLSFRSQPRGLVCPTANAHNTQQKSSKQVMKIVLSSMTSPIDVNNHFAAEFIHSLIYDHNRETLREEDVAPGSAVELYALSYRHESSIKKEAISIHRLRKAVQAIRSHAVELGRKYYSVWLDSLFSSDMIDPTTTSADRGLPPYALFYVVSVPSEEGFDHDFSRAWMQCEHQLAAIGRGLVLHRTDRPPNWTEGYHISTGQAHRMVYGAEKMPNYALYALAAAICFGMLDGASATFHEDLYDIKLWAANVASTAWSIENLYSLSRQSEPIKELEEHRARTLLNNSTNSSIGWEKDCSLITGHVAMLLPNGRRRKWNGGPELLHALSRYVNFSQADGTEEALHEEIRQKSTAFLVVCANGQEKGLFACFWKKYSVPILMEMEMVGEGDGSRSIVGYRIVHQHSIRLAFTAFEESKKDGSVASVGGVVCSRKCCELMEVLTRELCDDDEAVVDEVSIVDCSQWFIGMK